MNIRKHAHPFIKMVKVSWKFFLINKALVSLFNIGILENHQHKIITMFIFNFSVCTIQVMQTAFLPPYYEANATVRLQLEDCISGKNSAESK